MQAKHSKPWRALNTFLKWELIKPIYYVDGSWGVRVKLPFGCYFGSFNYGSLSLTLDMHDAIEHLQYAETGLCGAD